MNLYDLINGYQCVGRNCHLHVQGRRVSSTLNMEAGDSYETAPIYKTTQYHIPEDCLVIYI
jgi:hypothetical protein